MDVQNLQNVSELNHKDETLSHDNHAAVNEASFQKSLSCIYICTSAAHSPVLCPEGSDAVLRS